MHVILKFEEMSIFSISFLSMIAPRDVYEVEWDSPIKGSTVVVGPFFDMITWLRMPRDV